MQTLETHQPNPNSLHEPMDHYTLYGFEYEMKLRGLIDPLIDAVIIKRGREGMWEVINLILKFLYKYHKAEMMEIHEAVKQDRELANNQFASSKTQGLRKLGSIPERLESILRRAYLDELPMPQKEFRREFFKRYPQFRIAQKI